MKKLSLVEIPNHTWDPENSNSTSKRGSDQSNGQLSVKSSNTISYEDLIETKLNEDDGFVSNDEADEEKDSPERESPTKTGYYHSLPLKYSRQRKAALLEKKLSSVRGNVIREMVTTEQNYVKTLNDIVQGFLYPCRARRDLFTDKVTINIFSNIEDILKLHVRFLECLKSAVDEEDLSRSKIGNIFTLWVSPLSVTSPFDPELN
jgi:hypothetical protein